MSYKPGEEAMVEHLYYSQAKRQSNRKLLNINVNATFSLQESK